MCCRASEVRFYAAELEIGFMRAQPLKPAELLWRTLTEKLFSSNHMGFLWLTIESLILFPMEIRVNVNASFLVCLESDRPWKVVPQCLLNPWRGYCGKKDKIIEVKMNLLFMHIFVLLKNKSLFCYFYSYMRDIQHVLHFVSFWLDSFQTKGTLLSNDLKTIISVHFHTTYWSKSKIRILH